MDPNSPEALVRRREAALLTWRGPALMLFARAACAVGAQAVVAAVFALRRRDRVRAHHTAGLPGRLAIAGVALWRAGVSLHLGAHGVDDL